MNKSNSTDALYEKIRKELNAIIHESEKNEQNSNDSGDRNSNSDAASIKSNSLSSGQQQTKGSACSFGEKEIQLAKQFTFLNSEASQNIDVDLKRMQMDLQKSYELFQSIGEKFDTINFTALRSRIKDTHLINSKEAASKIDMKKVMNKNFVGQQLDQLTTEMGTKFKNHPGEFGDIPELSEFFQACTQLQHGLQHIRKHRTDVNDLESRMCYASELSYDRIDEIRKSLDDKLDLIKEK